MSLKRICAISACVGAAVAAICAAVLCARWYQDNRRGNFSRSAELFVYPGEDASEVLDDVAAEAGVRKRRSLERAFEDKRVSEFMQPGHYTVDESSSSVYVARMLNNGWQTPVSLTLSGNLRLKGNIAAKISSQLLLDSVSVRRAMDDEDFLARYGFSPVDVFNLIIPATYEIYWTAGVEDVFDRFKQAYDAFWTEENLRKAEEVGLDRREVGILASIVTAESNAEAEMPLIAGVYLNRLAIGMPLQADPTVAYCFDYSLSRILNVHLQVDSPYNTYRHAGLPPGPICVPVRAALEAVLNPDYGGPRGRGNLYFCANADFSGTHVFARTLSEHNRNAARFRAELDRRSRAARR